MLMVNIKLAAVMTFDLTRILDRVSFSFIYDKRKVLIVKPQVSHIDELIDQGKFEFIRVSGDVRTDADVIHVP